MAGGRPEISLALVGIGGYGNSYLSTLFEKGPERGLRLAAVADPNPSSCRHLAEIHRQEIPLYPTLEALQKRHSCALVIICTPLHLHSEQTIRALANGSHVLCEKPLSSTPRQAADMIAARDKAQKQVSIGYQWSFSVAIQALKRDIASGLFGKPKRLKTLVLWPRDEGYYGRNDWAGRRYSKTEQPIFDNPLNNACAHHLHNMMYVLGDRPDRSAMPLALRAELYRANDIETFDTAAVRVWTTDGVEVLCVVSHATQAERGPTFIFEFEHATVEFAGKQPTDSSRDGAELFARFKDGRVLEYGSPERAPDRKLWAAAESARSNTPTVCGIEASLSHTLLTDALHQSSAIPAEFPPSLKHTERQPNGHQRKWIKGLDEVLIKSYTTGKLPHELAVPWAAEGTDVHLPDRSIYTTELPRKVIERVQIQPFAAKRHEPV
jgi:predicted dehydrogenase